MSLRVVGRKIVSSSEPLSSSLGLLVYLVTSEGGWVWSGVWSGEKCDRCVDRRSSRALSSACSGGNKRRNECCVDGCGKQS